VVLGERAPDLAAQPLFKLVVFAFDVHVGCPVGGHRQPWPGRMRCMKAANMGTVKTVSPCVGLQTMPFAISVARVEASDDTFSPSTSATSPDRWGPSPSSAMARSYFFSFGVQRSKRTRKKPSSSAA